MLTKQTTHKIKTKRENRGFTLIEVLIAMAIFSIGILAIGHLQLISINSNARARMHTEGYTWMVDRIEWMTTLPYDDADLTAGDHGPVAEGIYTITWNVQDDTPLAGTKAITIRLTGANPRTPPLSINYIRAR